MESSYAEGCEPNSVAAGTAREGSPLRGLLLGNKSPVGFEPLQAGGKFLWDKNLCPSLISSIRDVVCLIVLQAFVLHSSFQSKEPVFL